ncbi:fungal hydrophobin-domain-containing protein [Coprinopsis sp. MPI-PUGE-AT-0042]|nr:fungal hydrophobin-domain-containing protein [Coprinopsis sp. MPI-PUGE-AT-0042]
MQFKLLTTLALAAAAIAVPTGGGGTPPTTPAPAPSCSTGPIQCCNSTTKASDPAASLLLGLLGIVLQDLNVIVGLTCSPISVIALPGNSCSGQTVCCSNNSFKGLIAIGCTPININV